MTWRFDINKSLNVVARLKIIGNYLAIYLPKRI